MKNIRRLQDIQIGNTELIETYRENFDNERIEDYVDKYVICHECNRPDTRIIREGRIFLLKCAACGATAPLKSL